MTGTLLETFIRKQLRLTAHRVTKLEESGEGLVVHIDRLERRRLRCGPCGRLCPEVHSRVSKERCWRDLSLRHMSLVLRYQPRRVRCAHCGLRVEAVPCVAGATADRSVIKLFGRGAFL